MLRDVNLKADVLWQEFLDSVAEITALRFNKMRELEKVKETERTKAHWTIKILSNYFNKRGGTSI